MYENGIRAFFRIVSIREVAVIICEDPAVKLVNRYRAGSSSQLWSSDIVGGVR
jgi:hypothetical protein